jgi:hypothetical protein
MGGWTRLFIIVAACWVLTSPFLAMGGVNSPTENIFKMCAETAYHAYGSSDSPRLDMERYRAEVNECSNRFSQNFVSIQKLLGAMFGAGDYLLGLIGWGFILIPLIMLWIIGRIARWVITGFKTA